MSEEPHEMSVEEAREELRISLPMQAFKDSLPYLLAFLAILIVGYWLIDPAPPKKMVISISKEDGNYQAYAHLYQALLQQDGITLEIRETEGPIQSLAELHKEGSGVDMAFVPGGIGGLESTVGLVSLGSLYYEPLWIFHKGKNRIEHLSQLKGKRIGVGRPNSSTRLLTTVILNAAGVNADNSTLYEIGEDDSKQALSLGIVDEIFLSGVPSSPLIGEVANMRGVSLVDLNESEALARQFTYLHHLALPESALSLQANIPPRKLDLLAPTVTLVARDSVHPALTYLLLKVLTRVHGGAGLLQHENEFPSDKDSDFELSDQAAYFYKSGPPFLDRYLPYWAATFVSRVLIILLPLLALAIPLSRVAPAGYTWVIKSRIHKLYGELRFLELQLRKGGTSVDVSHFRNELDAIENKVNHLRLPVAFSSHLYELRSHIGLVRKQMED